MQLEISEQIMKYKIKNIKTTDNIKNVSKVDNMNEIFPNDIIWRSVSEVKLECQMWIYNGYNPETSVKLFYTENGIYIRFRTLEKELRAIYKNNSDPVYKDSCVEFFLNAAPSRTKKYINFEFNSNGKYLIGIGEGRYDREVIEKADSSQFKIKVNVEHKNYSRDEKILWSLEFFIPFCFLSEIYGKLNFSKGKIMRGNFYKCGDDMTFPHYFSWNPVKSKIADFHNPKFFGKIILD